MAYNKNPISAREGKIFIDGVLVYDGVYFDLNFTPDTWAGNVLGERTKSTRYLGYSLSGKLKRRRATTWLKEAMKSYIDTGITPEFTITGIINDKNSDYYKEYGTLDVTAVGCVLTGDINIFKADAEGTILEDEISFSAYDIAG